MDSYDKLKQQYDHLEMKERERFVLKERERLRAIVNDEIESVELNGTAQEVEMLVRLRHRMFEAGDCAGVSVPVEETDE